MQYPEARSRNRLSLLAILLLSFFAFAVPTAEAQERQPLPPVVINLTPDSGQAGQSIQLSIQGDNFVDGAKVSFSGSGITVSSVNFVGRNELRINVDIALQALPGPRDVTVTNPGGQSFALSRRFIVVAAPIPVAAPVVTILNPDSGQAGQSIQLSIQGDNFVDGAKVSFSGSGINIASVRFVGRNELRIGIAIDPGASLGARDVKVTNPDEQSSMLRGRFTVVDITPPLAIGGLAAKDAHDGKVELTWAPSTAIDFDYYAVYVSEREITDVTGLTSTANVADVAVRKYVVAGLRDGVRYWFAVTVVDKSGNEGKLVIAVNATPTTSPVPAPFLKIARVTMLPTEAEAGDSVTISATIDNSGDGDALGVKASFIIDGRQIDSKTITVPAGDEVEAVSSWTAAEGPHKVVVVVAVDLPGVAPVSPFEIEVNVPAEPVSRVFPIIVSLLAALVVISLGIYWLVSSPRKRAREAAALAEWSTIDIINNLSKPRITVDR